MAVAAIENVGVVAADEQPQGPSIELGGEMARSAQAEEDISPRLPRNARQVVTQEMLVADHTKLDCPSSSGKEGS